MKSLGSILFLCIMVNSYGQPLTSGKIIFKETIKLKIDLGNSNPEMAKMIPSSQSVDKVLYFNSNESLYKNHTAPKDLEVKNEDEGNTFKLVLSMPESITYINKESDTYLQSQDLMGKEFLVTDKPIQHKWRVTGEQKIIMNYTCQKAIMNDTSRNVVAWFTTLIPVATGPAGITGLPGMILALEQNNGERMTLAVSVEPLPLDY